MSETQDAVRISNADAARQRLSESLDTTAPFYRQPMHLRPGIIEPTPENLDRVAREAAAKRAADASSPQAISQTFGISRTFALAWASMEGQILELKQEVAMLKQQIYNR